MILRALYDYYHNSKNMPGYGLSVERIAFIIVIDNEGNILRIEDTRDSSGAENTFIVKYPEARSSNVLPKYLYDFAPYVFGVPEDGSKKSNHIEKFNSFKNVVESAFSQFPDSPELAALHKFYQHSAEELQKMAAVHPLWKEILKNKKSNISFRLNNDTQIIAEKTSIIPTDDPSLSDAGATGYCLVTGKKSILTPLMNKVSIQGETAGLVTFQKGSGFDSYGKSQCYNAPISVEAEFAITTALKTLLGSESNSYVMGNVSFLYWASSPEATQQIGSFFKGFWGNDLKEANKDNTKDNSAVKVFKAIYSGEIKTTLDDKYFILGLSPAKGRIAVVYWAEIPLKEFAANILKHFEDMELFYPLDYKPSIGLFEIIQELLRKKKEEDVSPKKRNTPKRNFFKEIKDQIPGSLIGALIKSIFSGSQYPIQLLSTCINRIHAEQTISIGRAAIIKAYLNRLNNNSQKITPMLDTSNTNQGYLCGRLFAILVKIQEDANGLNSIRERYQKAAATAPASVFATLLNLSMHHSENLKTEASKIFYEKLIQEVVDKISVDGFPAHLDIYDQGRFFVGYYHQRQDLFKSKSDNNNQNNQ